MNPVIVRCCCLVIGYIFGSFQTAYFYGRMKGIDIRKHGSGNAGTTNTLRVLGTKAGLVVFAGDLLKSILAIVLCKVLFTGLWYQGGVVGDFSCIAPLVIIYAGLGCVLGHNFPFYLKFKGGKGIATTGGLMIAFHWWFIPVGLLVFFGNLAITHMVSLGSLLLYVGFFAQTIIMGQCFNVWNVEQCVLNELYIVVFCMACLAFIMHRSNIGRLIHGNERKTYLFKKNKMDAETNGDALNKSDDKEAK